jgi:hypothetical protein
MTVSLAATNVCGTSTRNPAFTTYGGYYFTTSATSPNSLAVVFDDIQEVSQLPEYIAVYNSATGREEVKVNVHEALARGAFNQNTLELTSDKLTSGVKIVKTFYRWEAGEKGKVSRTERVMIPR